MQDTIALNLARYRAEKGMTQRQLAEAAGLSWSQISRYESGAVTPRLGSLVRLADALGVTTEDLKSQPESIDLVFDVEFEKIGLVRCKLELTKDQHESLSEQISTTDQSGRNEILRKLVNEALLHFAIENEKFITSIRESKGITSIQYSSKASSKRMPDKR